MFPQIKLRDHPQDLSVSVCLVALNEASHILSALEDVQRAIGRGIAERVFVADGGSTDGTREIARSAGASVICVDEVMSDVGPVRGKGDSIWRALAVIPGDVVVFLDADITGDLAEGVRKLAKPIHDSASCHFVKGHFVRESSQGVGDDAKSTSSEVVGGRVTELMARPLLALLAPWLSAIHEPLSGQIAITRELGQALRVTTGYGLEIGMLYDVASLLGVGGIAEADIGRIFNPRKAESDLAAMSTEVFVTLLDRVCRALPEEIEQRPQMWGARRLLIERPPLNSVMRQLDS